MAENEIGDSDMINWKGFGRSNPWLGAALSVFLFSLAGIPPLAGFMGKWFVFIAAIQSDLVVPAILGILTSVIGAYYYISLVKNMYFDEKDKTVVKSTSSMAPMIGVATLRGIAFRVGCLAILRQGLCV
jgi:NADH-quinone oxidoreductase subunit N